MFRLVLFFIVLFFMTYIFYSMLFYSIHSLFHTFIAYFSFYISHFSFHTLHFILFISYLTFHTLHFLPSPKGHLEILKPFGKYTIYPNYFFLTGCLITVFNLPASHFLGSLKYISWWYLVSVISKTYPFSLIYSCIKLMVAGS